MFDFHIHVNCSGGRDGLLPSEAMRLAKCAGFRAVGLIVRADPSTLPILLPTLKTLVKTCSLYADIEAFAGVELVHVPPALLPDAVGQAMRSTAKASPVSLPMWWRQGPTSPPSMRAWIF